MDRWHIALLEPKAYSLTLDDEGRWASTPQRILRNRGYEVYYPAFPKLVDKSYGVHKLAMRPMFRGYMFVNESMRGWEWLRTTPGVRTDKSLLMINGHFAVLPPGEIDRIMECEKRLIDEILNPPPIELPYGVGDTVKITDGPFQGWLAQIETLDDDERVCLLLDIFGRPTRVYSSHEHLSAI